MTEWISLAVVLAIHDEQLAEHGGRPGIRDINLLESAIARPQQLETYGDPAPDMSALAAAYAFGIARNHAFIDGNKRTSLVVTETFLILNGYDILADDMSKLKIWLDLAIGDISEKACAEWLRTNIKLA
jgi:death on curing protein